MVMMASGMRGGLRRSMRARGRWLRKGTGIKMAVSLRESKAGCGTYVEETGSASEDEPGWRRKVCVMSGRLKCGERRSYGYWVALPQIGVVIIMGLGVVCLPTLEDLWRPKAPLGYSGF